MPRRRLLVDTQAPPILYIGDHEPLVVTLSARRWKRGGSVTILPDLDPVLEAQPEQRVALAPDGSGRVEIALCPKRRGHARVERVWLSWTGPLRLMSRRLLKEIALDVPVVPNVRAVRQAALRFIASRELRSGLKVERYVGDGSEFESLREYVTGLDHRAIEWKSSARHLKLLCQEFRAERNHQVVLAFDTGHLMCEPIDGVPKLDHGINAGLQIAYFSLKAGDRIGLYAFDEKVRTFSEPTGGVRAFQRLQKATAELEYTASETNFTLGIAELSTRLKRRSLLIVLTDFVDIVTARLMIENLDRLARRHLIVFVTLRDPGLDELAARAPESLGDLHRAVVAGDFLREREVVLRRIQRLGVHCIDAPPSQVSTRLLNRYLEIKRRELI
jgi:uncharacterized protein (DUF58 family)